MILTGRSAALYTEARGYSTIQRRKLVPPSRLAENGPSLGNIEELTSWILTVPFLYFFCCPSFEFPSEPFQFKSGLFLKTFSVLPHIYGFIYIFFLDIFYYGCFLLSLIYAHFTETKFFRPKFFLPPNHLSTNQP